MRTLHHRSAGNHFYILRRNWAAAGLTFDRIHPDLTGQVNIQVDNLVTGFLRGTEFGADKNQTKTDDHADQADQNPGRLSRGAEPAQDEQEGKDDKYSSSNKGDNLSSAHCISFDSLFIDMTYFNAS